MPLADRMRMAAAGVSGAGYEVDYSVRVNGPDDSSYLKHTHGAAGDTQSQTYSFWVKRGDLGTENYLLTVYVDGNNHDFIVFDGNDKLRIDVLNAGANDVNLISTMVFRDPHAWYHIVVAFDMNDGVQADRVIAYVNNERITAWDTATLPSDNSKLLNFMESGSETQLGALNGNSRHDGYFSQCAGVDGSVLTPSSFGEADDNGVWRPIDSSSLDFGSTEGWFLDFAVAPATGNGAGTDVSGNSNHFTDVNLAAVDRVIDTPTNNYCVMTSIYPDTGPNADGNLTCITAGNDGDQPIGSMSFDATDSDGFYFEMIPTGTSSGGNPFAFGVVTIDHAADLPRNDISDARSWTFANNGGATHTSYIARNTWNSGESRSAPGTGANGLTYMIAVKNGGIYFGFEGAWWNGDDTFADATPAFTGLTGQVVPFFQHAHASAGTVNVNFGSTGYDQTKPTGLKDICTTNLTAPTITDPSTLIGINSYTATGSTLVVTSRLNADCQPDLAIIKKASGTGAIGWRVVDSTRGAGDELIFDTPAAATGAATGVTAFGDDGVTVGADTDYNDTTGTGVYTYLGLKKNVVSFDIVQYSGTGVAQNISHGLTNAPDAILVKNQDAAESWALYISGYGNTGAILLDGTGNISVATTLWNDTSPTSSVFTVGTGSLTNQNGTNNMIAYLWSNGEIFQSGSFKGNGAADGPLIMLPFAPVAAWLGHTANSGQDRRMELMITGHANNTDYGHYRTGVGEAVDASQPCDFGSNFLKYRGGASEVNLSSAVNLYMAWAESPFGGHGGTFGGGVSPITAR